MSKKNIDKPAYPYLCLQKIELDSVDPDIVFYSILIFLSKTRYTCLHTTYDYYEAIYLVNRFASDLSVEMFEVL